MKLLKEFISKSHLPAKLIRSTVRQIGGWDEFKEQVKDIASHGADSGWHGFMYYQDTVPFAKRNEKEILDCIRYLAEELGENLYQCLANFNCLKRLSFDDVIGGLLNSRSEYKTEVYNALAWYTLEEVARSYVDLSYNEYCD